MKDDRKQFEREKIKRIRVQGKSKKLAELADAFLVGAAQAQYTYNFSWLGAPIFHHPEDIIATQEIIWRVRPKVIVDIGVARGGSSIFYASMLHLIGGGKVIGVDIDVRAHNRKTIEEHRFGGGIELIEGSSVDKKIYEKVRVAVGSSQPVLVSLDSLHTGDHVYKELMLYSTLVTKNSYLLVGDTVLKKLPINTYPKAHANRPWSQENNPATAITKFLEHDKNFAIDIDIDSQLLISDTPGGYLKRIR